LCFTIADEQPHPFELNQVDVSHRLTRVWDRCVCCVSLNVTTESKMTEGQHSRTFIGCSMMLAKSDRPN